MNRTKVKLIIAGLVLAGAVSYLAYAGVKKGWVYYVQVDQFLSDQQYQQKRVRLCGKVAEENFTVTPGKLRANFTLVGEKGGMVPVAYKGAIPDLFNAGCEAVVEGKLDPTGTFQADTLMTKCASKYENGKMVPAPEKGQ